MYCSQEEYHCVTGAIENVTALLVEAHGNLHEIHQLSLQFLTDNLIDIFQNPGGTNCSQTLLGRVSECILLLHKYCNCGLCDFTMPVINSEMGSAHIPHCMDTCLQIYST